MREGILFLKHSSIIDLVILFLAVFTGVVLVIVGVVMLFVVKTRKFFIIYLTIALLPLVLGIAGAGFRWYMNERGLAMFLRDAPPEELAELRRGAFPEYVATILIGAGATALPLLIGVSGAVVKKDRPNVTASDTSV